MRSVLLLALLACGTSPSVEVLPDAPGVAIDADDRLCMALTAGQSNAIGLMSQISVDLAMPYPAVQFVQHNSGAQNPPQYVDEGPIALQPRTRALAGLPAGTAGIELTMARVLDAAMPGRWVAGKVALDSSGLENNWIPASGYPATGKAYFDQTSDWIAWALEVTHARLCAVAWLQGERDAAESPDNVDYLVNLRALFYPWRARFGDFTIVITRLSVQSKPGGGAPQVRDAQAVFEAQNTGVIVVDTDDLALRDQVHYADVSYLELGRRVGAAILGAN